MNNFYRLKRLEKEVAHKWFEFSSRHHRSALLPVVLFVLLFVDGFVMIIPSNLCLIAAVTVSPTRWLWFGSLASVAFAANNAISYLIGRSFSGETMNRVIELIGIESLWQKAQHAVSDYGPVAAFIGVLGGLPTQIMTAIMGMADAKGNEIAMGISSKLLELIGLVFAACILKFVLIAALTRYGLVRLEKRLGNQTI